MFVVYVYRHPLRLTVNILTCHQVLPSGCENLWCTDSWINLCSPNFNTMWDFMGLIWLFVCYYSDRMAVCWHYQPVCFIQTSTFTGNGDRSAVMLSAKNSTIYLLIQSLLVCEVPGTTGLLLGEICLEKKWRVPGNCRKNLSSGSTQK